MRPIIFAGVLAIGIHGLLFGMEFDCFKKKHVYRTETKAITMTLTYLQPQVIESKLDATKSVVKTVLSPVLQEKPLISKKIVKIPVEPEEIIFEESETQEEIVTDIKVVAAVDIEKKTLLVLVREAVPLYKVNPPPEYPRIARKRGYQGTVVLEVLVDRNGRVGDLRLFTSSGYSILDRKAMASVKWWLFEPGMKGDKKLDMWVRVPVSFQLR